MSKESRKPGAAQGMREVPVDWEALEDAFENNAPEVHSYLHLVSGEVLRVVDGIADPEMHSRIAADSTYLRIESVSSREQYRWMERFIQMVDETGLRASLAQAIDGKGAFRRFKDVLMAHGAERERWFAFRSERLRVFMEAWLAAHALTPVARPEWRPEDGEEGGADEPAEAKETEAVVVQSPPKVTAPKRGRSADSLRKQIRDLAESFGSRELDKVLAFAEFIAFQKNAALEAKAAEHSVEQASEPQAAETEAQEDEPPSSEPRKVTLVH